ncbi:MAG: murein biosynthesis integral membrane protein MurJ [Leptospirales bacterium]|nr:murein biosynthesis integral membrane protein MurJ [Leptospirales bacterium]
MASTARNSLRLSLVTIVSRITGLVRDHYQAVFFGTGPISAAWEIAYMLPNMLRNLLAEGVLSQAFVPIYSGSLKESEERARRTSGVILCYLFFVLLAVVILGWITFPFLLPLYTGRTGEEANLVITLASILFPFILTTSLASIYMGMANTRQSFFIPSLSPVLLNLILISGFLVLAQLTLDDFSNVKWLAAVTIAGGFAQLIFQATHVWKKGWAPRFNLDLKDPALKKIYTLMAPAVIGASIFQLNQLLDVAIASYMIPDPGAITGLRFAHRLIQLPTGVIGVALSTAILPVLARAIREDKKEEIPHELSHALSFSFFLNVPAGIGLYVLGPDIINLLFFGGDWDLKSTAITWAALQFYCIGIPLYSANRIVTSSFYAYEDTKSPVRILIGVVILNFALNLVLVPHLMQGGLALSTSFCAVVNFAFLYRTLKKHVPSIQLREAVRSILRQVPGYLLLVSFLWILSYFRHDLVGLLSQAGILGSLPGPRQAAWPMVVVGAGGGGLLYVASGFLFRIPELEFLRRRFGLTSRS